MSGCVLIVEDEPLIALSVEETLRDAGYSVCGGAGSQAEALSMGEGSGPNSR